MTKEYVSTGVIVLSTGRRIPLGRFGPDGEMLTRPETREVRPGETFTLDDKAELERLLRLGVAVPAGGEEAAEAIRRSRGAV